MAQDHGATASKMLAHWQCAQWATMTDNATAAEHHFSEGLIVGRDFVTAAREGQVSREEFNESVPLSVALTLSGPSADFVLGRLFEMIGTAAYESVTQRDGEGRPLPPAEYVLDAEVATVIAATRYRQANCSLI